LKTDKRFVDKYRGELASGILEINKLKNANYEEPNKAVVQSVEFHPKDNIVLTAGLDRTLRLFKVDSTENVKISSVHLKDLPIYSAHFILEGKENKDYSKRQQETLLLLRHREAKHPKSIPCVR